jgi:hypothetical protein
VCFRCAAICFYKKNRPHGYILCSDGCYFYSTSNFPPGALRNLRLLVCSCTNMIGNRFLLLFLHDSDLCKASDAHVQSIRANLVTMARDTSLMGLSALLSVSLLPAATASSRWPTAASQHHPDNPHHAPLPCLAATDLLPDDLLPSALSALRTMNGVAPAHPAS